MLSLIYLESNAQFNSDFKKKYKQAYEYIDNEDFQSALPVFLNLDSLAPENANINFNVGLCYVSSTLDKIKAIPFLEKAIKNISLEYIGNYDETTAPVFAYYYLGRAYMIAYRIDEAIEYLYRFRYYLTSKNREWIKEVDRQISMCYNAKIIIPNPIKADDDNLGININTRFPEYSPVISHHEDTLIFTSRRPGTTGGNMEINGKFYEDIYISIYDKSTKSWTKAKQIGSNINSAKHEASISLSPDGTQLFVYRDDGNADGNIYLSTFKNNEWSTLEKLPEPINTKAWETHACLSPDGRTLYFTSNRKGGFGGRDIYKCNKQADGTWGKAKNIGRKINTAGDEDSPFVVEDSSGTTLYFSSNGHQSIGGFDVFYSKLAGGEDSWENPENIGYPINTTDDDVFFVPTADRKYAYYSSSKPGGFGDLDIYKVYIGGKAKPKLILKGVVIDSATNKHIQAHIKIRDIDSDIILISFDADTINTEYHVFMPVRKNLEITVSSEDYKTYTENFITPISSENNIEIYKKFILKKAPPLFTLNQNAYKRNDCYTVQIGAGKMKPDHFNTVPNVKIFDCSDGIRRFVVGEFASKEEAYVLREQMATLGFIGSWVRECIDTADMAIGERIVLRNIFFDFNKTTLRPESTKELQKLVKLLNDNPTFQIEVAGHTDNIGTEDYNMELSTGRAYVVYSYLIKNGIDKMRLSYKGYAFKQPIATNTTDAGRQMNRRTEFRILSK